MREHLEEGVLNRFVGIVRAVAPFTAGASKLPLRGFLPWSIAGTAIWASFITYWPYNLTPTLKNYDFGTFDAQAWSPYFNSLKMAAMASLIGTAIVFTGAMSYGPNVDAAVRLARSILPIVRELEAQQDLVGQTAAP